MEYRTPIGLSDFRKLREAGAEYLDKSRFIVDVVEQSTEVLLLPRPRRFGKTLNLSMLRWFFERSEEDHSALFEDLEVWRAGEEVRSCFQRFPVISLTFKDVKHQSWEACLQDLGKLLAAELRRHRSDLERLELHRGERSDLDALLDGTAGEVVLGHTLKHLSRWLFRATGERAVILIDEYDTPINAGFSGGYYDEVTGFLRNLLSGGLKDNEFLFRGVLTGILRVAKEGIFSGLNNIKVHSTLTPRFSTYFGFTEAEVEDLLERVGLSHRLAEVRDWYDGYRFAGHTIYNPWSVLNFIQDDPETPGPYWVNTSSNDLLGELLTDRSAVSAADVAELLAGGSIWQPIHEHVVLRDVYLIPDAAWSLLLFSGYLNAVELRTVDDDLQARLALPNREVRKAFRSAIKNWSRRVAPAGRTLDAMLDAMLSGDTDHFGRLLSVFARDVLSFHDTADKQPERVFHAFALGLFVQLEPRWRVRSNRESGYGRADVLIVPQQAGVAGVVLELKRVDAEFGETVEGALDSALAQIDRKDYAAEIRAAGADPVLVYAAAFDGKRVWVRAGPSG